MYKVYIVIIQYELKSMHTCIQLITIYNIITYKVCLAQKMKQ